MREIGNLKPFLYFCMLKELFFMKNNRPLILISNDDGYQAKGINCLIDMVRHLGDIIVCAPVSARSGYSGAFSATLPLRLNKHHEEEGLEICQDRLGPYLSEEARHGIRWYQPR